MMLKPVSDEAYELVCPRQIVRQHEVADHESPRGDPVRVQDQAAHLALHLQNRGRRDFRVCASASLGSRRSDWATAAYQPEPPVKRGPNYTLLLFPSEITPNPPFHSV
jgi:hypothetical protein